MKLFVSHNYLKSKNPPAKQQKGFLVVGMTGFEPATFSTPC